MKIRKNIGVDAACLARGRCREEVNVVLSRRRDSCLGKSNDISPEGDVASAASVVAVDNPDLHCSSAHTFCEPTGHYGATTNQSLRKVNDCL